MKDRFLDELKLVLGSDFDKIKDVYIKESKIKASTVIAGEEIRYDKPFKNHKILITEDAGDFFVTIDMKYQLKDSYINLDSALAEAKHAIETKSYLFHPTYK